MARLKPIRNRDWSRARARHLLSRAGFGVPLSLVDKLTELGPEGAVSYIVDFEHHPYPVSQPAFLLPPINPAELRRQSRGRSDALDRLQQRAVAERRAVALLQAWWLERMYRTRRPLEEKMTLFWHGHFATSAQKVPSSYHNYQLNQVFRQHAAGNFKALTVAVAQSPAMLRYLDNDRSTKEHPNENWARELLELFTLGGGYTESDIKAAAMAFTGWTSDGGDFVYRLSDHDSSEKEFLGTRGRLDGWAVLDTVFREKRTASFICRKLWAYFAYEEPADKLVEVLAERLREHHYEVKPVLRELFLSQAFYSEQAVATQVKSPVQYLLLLSAHLELSEPPFSLLAQASASLEQHLFYPPSVKGWDGNRAWINANSLLRRYNLPKVIASEEWRERRAESVTCEEEMAQSEVKRGTSAREEQPRKKLRSLLEHILGVRADSESTVAPSPAANVPAGEMAPGFAGIAARNAGECIDALAARLFVVKPNAAQRQTLIEALGATAAADPIAVATVPIANQFSVLHLMTSMAEYQLC